MERDDNLDLLLFLWLVGENWGNLRPWYCVGTLTSISSILLTSKLDYWCWFSVDSRKEKKKKRKKKLYKRWLLLKWLLVLAFSSCVVHNNSTRFYSASPQRGWGSLAFVLMSAGIREQPSARRPDIPAGYGLLRLASTDIFLFFMATCAETSAPLCLTLVPGS